MKKHRKHLIVAVSVMTVVSSFAQCENDADEIAARIAVECKNVRRDKFFGFDRTSFEFHGHQAWVVSPKGKSLPGSPWTWTMQWATSFVPRTSVPQLLVDGYHHVTIDTFQHRMDETGLKVSCEFQKFLVEKLGFAKKVDLVGLSWGGFFAVRYANRYPENVSHLYLDGPLMSFQRFACPSPWHAMPPADGDWSKDPRMPITMGPSLAKANIPILLLYGGQDQTCIPSANCEPFIKAFQDAGGVIKVIKRDAYGHHPHGVEPGEPTIRFFFEDRDGTVKKR